MDDPNLNRINDPRYSDRPGLFEVRDDLTSSVFRKIRGISTFFPSGCLELVGSELLTSFSGSWHEYFISVVRQMVYQVS